MAPAAPATVTQSVEPPRKRPTAWIILGAFAIAALLAAAALIGWLAADRQSADPIEPAAVATTDSQPSAADLRQDAEPATEAESAEPLPSPRPDPAEPAPTDSTLGVDTVEPVVAVAREVSSAVVLVAHQAGQGSGIIYDESGLILTNAHVVGQFNEVTIRLASGTKVIGTVLGADENTDVAVIQIDADEEFGVAELAPQSQVQVGQLAVAVGSPFGLEQTVTSGVVSAKGRLVGNVAMIQTDASINPGNSGGALADRQGRVVGMNTAIRTDQSGGSVGVGFAIPADTALLIAERILSGESLDQGFLGIMGASPTLGTPGALVMEVTPDTGAATAGIRPEDLIVGFAGMEIKEMSDLIAAVRLQQPNATVPVEILRDGQPLTVQVTLGVNTN